jgi:hypothetical protein
VGDGLLCGFARGFNGPHPVLRALMKADYPESLKVTCYTDITCG